MVNNSSHKNKHNKTITQHLLSLIQLEVEGLFGDFYWNFSGYRQTSIRRNASVLYETPQREDYLPKFMPI